MKIELELNGQILLAVDAQELESVYTDCKCLVDLRKAQERTDDPAPRCKEKGIAYVQVPVTPGTLSEQDLDFLRRETARRWGKMAVLSGGGQRAAALLLMHAGRSGQWSDEDTLARCPELEASWQGEIKTYLARHRERQAP